MGLLGIKRKGARRRGRFDCYEALADRSEPERCGLLVCEQDFNLGTPNLSRPEDVTLLASNSLHGRETLWAQIKWRPNESDKSVTLLSKLHVSLPISALLDETTGAAPSNEVRKEGARQEFEFEEVLTYEPLESSVRGGRILQYGSRDSQLKLIVSLPFRRMRLVFNGHMEAANGARVYLKLSCVSTPTARLFDFLEQYDSRCVEQQVEALAGNLKTKRTAAQMVNELILHDRHEQQVKFQGEYLLIQKASPGNCQQQQQQQQQSKRVKRSLSLWGFYSRQFLLKDNVCSLTSPRRRRLYCHMVNGQAFHCGATWESNEQQVGAQFGYTRFELAPVTEPIDKSFEMDWKALDDEQKGNLQTTICGQGKSLTFAGELCAKQGTAGRWFDVTMDGQRGWAFVTETHSELDTSEELACLNRSREERRLALEEGRIAGATSVAAGQTNSDSRLLVVSLSESSCLDAQLVGAKAASLGHLSKFSQKSAQGDEQTKSDDGISFRVSPGFVLTRHAHDLLLARNPNIGEALARLEQVATCGPQGPAEFAAKLAEQCQQVEQLVRSSSCTLPAEIRQQLSEKLNDHYGSDRLAELRFAVRSSSWGEDELDMSAAGQLKTVLNVRASSESLGDELSGAIMECFASKFTHENVEYKRQHGMPLSLPMAVVVQEMVACQRAGVMFTCEPTLGDRSLLTITANYGLGESVVSGQTDPDSIRVRRNGREEEGQQLVVEQIEIGQKRVIIEAEGGAKQDGTKQEHFDSSKCCLEEGQILALARCGLSLARYFEGPSDVEWGYDGRGCLFIFQTRPITGLESYTQEELLSESDQASAAEQVFATRANVGEVMTNAVHPYALTSFVFRWDLAMRRLKNRLLSSADIDSYVAADYQHHCQCANENFTEKYHCFFNLRPNLFALIRTGDKQIDQLVRAMQLALFGHEVETPPGLTESNRTFKQLVNPFVGPKYNLLSCKYRAANDFVLERSYKRVINLRQQVDEGKLAQIAMAAKNNCSKLEALYEQLKLTLKNDQGEWENHLFAITMGSASNLEMSQLFTKYLDDPLQAWAATNKFLALTPNVLSAEIPARIATIAGRISARNELDKFLAIASEKEALEYLMGAKGSVTKKDPLARSVESFFERFGHRCYGEFDVANKAWREEPGKIVDMIRANCAALKANSIVDNTTTGGASDKKANNNNKLTTQEQILKSLGLDERISLKDRLQLKYVLAPACQKRLAMRERTKDTLIALVDVNRRACRQLAAEMVKQARLPDEELFYYLFYDELEPLVRDFQPELVVQAARRRQLFRRSFSRDNPWKFDEIITSTVPKHLQPSEQFDERLMSAPKLTGTPASSGKVRGKICLVASFNQINKVLPGTILLTHSTDIAFSPVFPIICGIITEVGGLISHGAVVAREYGLPSVIGIPNVTKILQDGEEILLDADSGVIVRLGKAVAENGAADASAAAVVSNGSGVIANGNGTTTDS